MSFTSLKHKVVICRLVPGDDLYISLNKICVENNISAGSIITCVGSLSSLIIRTSNLSILKKEGNFEIVSLVGNISIKRSHLHISVSDENGVCFGGHLLEGNTIHTTAEISILCYEDIEFDKEFDKRTGFNELEIKKK